MRKKVFMAFLMMLFCYSSLFAATSHDDKISSYEGTKTCTGCHEKAAKDVAESLHYQQQAEPKFLVDWPKGKTAGMMVSF